MTIARKKILKRFRKMIAKGEPIIGGGAGTGLSAKCEEEGGIDLIVIYNSGRYRMAGQSLSFSAVPAPIEPPVVRPIWQTTMSAPALAMARASSSQNT